MKKCMIVLARTYNNIQYVDEGSFSSKNKICLKGTI